ncbi:DUF2188 domain-containing protein [Sediminimonas sp.]|uniref:DUF2188 domain-containing protein n=1 Tax=Sediminimonas sp. TaxID=2823379 RepID=UPI0034580362
MLLSEARFSTYTHRLKWRSNMSSKGLHVVPSDGRWSVRRAGASRASKVYSTQKEAIDSARERARSEGGELYIHGRDGRIRERDTFGQDPYPPKG